MPLAKNEILCLDRTLCFRRIYPPGGKSNMTRSVRMHARFSMRLKALQRDERPMCEGGGAVRHPRQYGEDGGADNRTVFFRHQQAVAGDFRSSVKDLAAVFQRGY